MYHLSESQSLDLLWGPNFEGHWENHALYIADPSGNCVEFFCDIAIMDPYTNRVNETWFRDRLARWPPFGSGRPTESVETLEYGGSFLTRETCPVVLLPLISCKGILTGRCTTIDAG